MYMPIVFLIGSTFTDCFIALFDAYNLRLKKVYTLRSKSIYFHIPKVYTFIHQKYILSYTQSIYFLKRYS
jgi:hypothetical protein